MARDPFKAKGQTPIEFDGFHVSVFRDKTDGTVTVQILTHDADERDTFAETAVPRLRLVVNESSETTRADGTWEGES